MLTMNYIRSFNLLHLFSVWKFPRRFLDLCTARDVEVRDSTQPRSRESWQRSDAVSAFRAAEQAKRHRWTVLQRVAGDGDAATVYFGHLWSVWLRIFRSLNPTGGSNQSMSSHVGGHCSAHDTIVSPSYQLVGRYPNRIVRGDTWVGFDHFSTRRWAPDQL